MTEEEELSLEETKQNFKEMEEGFVSFRDRLNNNNLYSKAKILIKVKGNILFIYFLVTENYLWAFMMFFFFVPDLVDVNRFLKRKFL